MIVEWSSNVNTKVLRSGSQWAEVPKYIEDGTRSGKVKRRKAYSQEKRPFSVRMKFTPTEYEYFRNWYEETTLSGLYDFTFPQIDSVGHITNKVYRFASVPQYENPNGQNIYCNMGWLEV